MRRKETSGGRLIRRQLLFHVRRVTSDYALFFAAIGIGLMIIDNEMSAAKIYQRGSYTSLILKALILLSTIILVILVIKFHVHEVQVSFFFLFFFKFDKKSKNLSAIEYL
ncbi:unnamed protein product [Brugia pahangi]|uniref:7TM_GPCR_Srx domain-containing protein n=1 Tax=Brugia pahangi TaxID=6280 RepID=A0A0N4TA41_BRUPA|nr:unnamed protein product [Brugia pahangi]